MKKLVLFCIIVFLFCGCSSSKTVTPLTKGIKFSLVVSCKPEKYEVSATIDKGGCLEAYVNSPDDLKGMKFTVNSFESSVKYKGITYNPKSGELLELNNLKLLYDTFNSLKKQKLTLKSGDNCVVEGDLSGNKYTFTFSPSGLPLELNIKGETNLKMVFNNTVLLYK